MSYRGNDWCYSPPPTRCSSGPRPGTRVLYDYCRLRWPFRNSGIYNCRTNNVPGGSRTLSRHASGSAGDLGNPIVNGRYDKSVGWEAARWLVENAIPLGVQRVIHDRREWDSRNPQQRRWNTYSGYPHEDHVHFELCNEAAYNLTSEDINRLEGHPMEGFNDTQVGQLQLIMLDAVVTAFNDPDLIDGKNRAARILHHFYDKGVAASGKGWKGVAATFANGGSEVTVDTDAVAAELLAGLMPQVTATIEDLAETDHLTVADVQTALEAVIGRGLVLGPEGGDDA